MGQYWLFIGDIGISIMLAASIGPILASNIGKISAQIKKIGPSLAHYWVNANIGPSLGTWANVLGSIL